VVNISTQWKSDTVNTGMRRIMTFRSTTDRIYDGGPIIYYNYYGSTENSKGNKTVPEKVATKRTEDGHK